MAITDLGLIQQSGVPLRIAWAKIGAGNMYSYWWYSFATQSAIHTNLISLNHDTDAVIGAVQGPLGRPYANFQHPNGLIYLGTYCSSDVSGKLGSFNFQTGAYVALANTPTWAGSPTEDGILSSMWSDEINKRIFCGSSSKAGLFAYDPVLGSVEDFGILDDPGSPYNRYVQNLQVDSTFAYCSIKDVTNNVIYLLSVRLTDNIQTAFWKADGISTCEIRRGSDENIYIKKIVSGVTTWYLANGTDAPILQGGTPDCYGVTTRSYINYTGYNNNSEIAYPPGDGTKGVTLRYKRPGDTDWRTAAAELVDLDSYAPNTGGLDLDGNIIFYCQGYAPALKYNPLTDVKTLLGAPSGSGYSMCQDFFRQLMFFGGYAYGMTFRYDPTQPWIVGTNPVAVVVDNPLSPVVQARYAYACERMSDGYIWWIFNWVRTISEDPLEAQVSWYDPDTATTGTVDFSILRNYNLDNAAFNWARNKVVFSGYKTGDSFLAVIPIRKQAISKYLVPIAGGVSQGRIVSVEHDLSTVNHFVGVTLGASYKTYCVNIGTGALVWGPDTNTGTSSFAPLSRPGVGPLFAHSYCWFYVGNTIVRLNPTTGLVTTAFDLSGTSYAGQMVWVGDYLYHWDTTTKHLFKIPKTDLV